MSQIQSQKKVARLAVDEDGHVVRRGQTPRICDEDGEEMDALALLGRRRERRPQPPTWDEMLCEGAQA